MDSNGKNNEHKIRRILFYEVKEALDELKDTGENKLLTSQKSWENLSSLLKTLLNSKPNVILFLGAGTSMSIKKTPKVGEAPYQPPSWEDLIKRLFLGLDNSLQKEFLRDQTIDHEDEVSEEDRSDLAKWFERVKVFRDKPTLTWHLRQYFHEDKIGKPNERNALLYRLVSEPLESGNYESELLRQIVKLPFDDIITTNYDTSISKFLEDEKKYRTEVADDIKFYRGYDIEAHDTNEIFNPKTFLQSITERKQRLYYIHGKADKNGENFLVFDKFDFANLIAGVDTILDYAIGQIIGSTLVYFGFGLDDQTFNYVQERLRKIYGEKNSHLILHSYTFSTQTSGTEIEAFRKKHINVIGYNSHETLPKILRHINTILEYFRQIPENELANKDIRAYQNLTSGYQNAGREAYISDEYEESLKNYRLAMATLLFSEDADEIKKSQNPEPYWKYVKELINIRRHLVLNLSKLRWKESGRNYQTRTSIVEGDLRIRENIYDIETGLLNGTIDRAIELLKDFEESFSEWFSNSDRLGIEARKASLSVLRARIKAHEGDIRESYNKYDIFEKAFKQDIPLDERLEISENDKFLYRYTETRDFLQRYTELLDELENVSYTEFLDEREKSHQSEVASILASNDNAMRKTEKMADLKNSFYKYEINEDTLLLGYSYIFAREQRRRHKTFLGQKYPRSEEVRYWKNYKNLLRELTSKSNKTYFKPEFSTSLQTLADVLMIGLWEIGSRFVRYASGDILPKFEGHEEEFEENITDSIALLKTFESKIPIDDRKAKMPVQPSPRWQTRMHRHKCRAHMLRWVKNRQTQTADERDLLAAFTSFKKALDISERANLRGEFLKNCLESARMNTLVMMLTAGTNPGYAVSEAACYYYLSQSVEVIHELLGKTLEERELDLSEIQVECRRPENQHIWWLMIFVLKITSYFSLVIDDQGRSATKQEVFLKLLVKEILDRSPEERKNLVSNEYREYCESVMGEKSVLDNLIRKFEIDFDKIRDIRRVLGTND